MSEQRCLVKSLCHDISVSVSRLIQQHDPFIQIQHSLDLQGLRYPAVLDSSCTPLSVIGISGFNPHPLFEALDDEDYKTRVELRSSAALTSNYQEIQRTSANSVQGRSSTNWAGAIRTPPLLLCSCRCHLPCLCAVC